MFWVILKFLKQICISVKEEKEKKRDMGMGRKLNKSFKNEKAHNAEKESLLPDQNPPLNRHHTPANLRLPEKITERKKSIWAPPATATTFEDVPVFTVCPYCSSKVVTKTQFKKGKKHWYDIYPFKYLMRI